MAETIGQQLSSARQSRQLSLEEAARATHIRQRYLEALETDRFAELPSLVQARGFLRAYAGYLGLDPARLLAGLDTGSGAEQNGGTGGDKSRSPGQPAGLGAEQTFTAAPHPTQAGAPRAKPAEQTPTNVELIFIEIGRSLKHQRELLSLTLDDVERHTYLRQNYLNALENGRWEDLPSPVQGRGMLKNYAEFLGMDPDPLLLRFAAGLQANLTARQEARTVPRARRTQPKVIRAPGPLRRIFSGEFLVAVVLIAALVGFAGWGALRILGMRTGQAPEPTAPSIAEVLLDEPTPRATSTQPPPTATSALPIAQPPPVEGEQVQTPQAEEDGNVRVYITVRQRAWTRIGVDGEVVFEGRLLPGNAFQYTGSERVEILTGNGAGLQVFFNQQDLGALGLFGQIVYQVYTLDGVQTPTPTVTLTPTITPTPTRTPRATATGTP